MALWEVVAERGECYKVVASETRGGLVKGTIAFRCKSNPRKCYFPGDVRNVVEMLGLKMPAEWAKILDAADAANPKPTPTTPRNVPKF